MLTKEALWNVNECDWMNSYCIWIIFAINLDDILYIQHFMFSVFIDTFVTIGFLFDINYFSCLEWLIGVCQQ